MTKIIIALSLILPLITPTSTPSSGPYSRYSAAIGWQDTDKLLGEIFEDDTNLVFSFPLSKSFHHPIEPAQTATNFYFVIDSHAQGTFHKKVLPLFKLKNVLLI